MNDIESIWRETVAGFEWLARDLDRDIEVSFVPNPGNIGDALINLSCYRYLAATFRKVIVSRLDLTPATEHVFVGGGGNLVEGFYADIADFLSRLEPGKRAYVFPSSVKGYGQVFDRLNGRVRLICREAVSFEHMRRHLPEPDVMLAHDAAFAMADRLHIAFREAILRHPQRSARFYRTDLERAIEEKGDGDIMARESGAWLDLAEAEGAVLRVTQKILGFGRIHTDRLHCAILSAMLGRYVILRPNSYYKNEAVFDHSLSRLANVRLHREAVHHAR